MGSLDMGQDVGFHSADTFKYIISLNLQNNLISKNCYFLSQRKKLMFREVKHPAKGKEDEI